MENQDTQQQSEKKHESERQQPKKNNLLIEDENLLAAISYAAIGFIIPLITQPKNEKLQYHAKQGLIVFLGWILVLIILVIMPLLGLLLFMAYFAFNVIVIYRAYNGEFWKIPFVADFAKKVDLDKISLSSQSKKEPEEEKKPDQPSKKEHN